VNWLCVVNLQAVQLQELESMRQELTVAYDTNADLRDRILSLQQQMAAMKAEAAARTPVGVTVEKVGVRLRQQLCNKI
jgi:3-phenylpropionate/cinnamic acid dioxygenase small subunit